jgi:hypothetical protein
MQVRILSQVVTRWTIITLLTLLTLSDSRRASAQGSGYVKDPSTGIVYRPVTRTVERPVVDETIESRKQTVYRPQTVTETRPSTRSVYTPIIEYNWEPRVEGRWNPFRRPTVAYHHVPQARWERRDDVVQQTTTRTEWVAETRDIQVPRRIVRMQRQQQTDYEPVGQLASTRPPSSAGSSIASRLQPLNANEQIVPMGQANYSAPRIASSSVGQMASSSSTRTDHQAGMRATTLTPTNATVIGQPLPPVSNGMATSPAVPFFR